MKLNWFHYLCLIFDDVYIQLLVCSFVCSFQGTIQFAELLQRLGLSGLEPPTSRLSGVRSNRLSYKPIESGIHLLSHAVSSIVSSAAWVLTIVFGMGTGVSPKRIDTRNLFVILDDKTVYPTLTSSSLERR